MAGLVEEFFTVDEVAEILKISPDTVRAKFAQEDGVIDLGTSETTRKKRRYRVLRIPRSTLNRVITKNRV